MSRAIVRFSGVLGATGVAAGAFGAHKLEATWQQWSAKPPELSFTEFHYDESETERFKNVWTTGHRMHLFGATTTLAIAAAGGSWTKILRSPTPAAIFIGGGSAVFAGACYLQALFMDRKFGRGAPIGGTAMIAGFVLLTLSP